MIQVDIPAAARTVFGKGESRRLRMDKKTPAVVYSKGEEALPLQFDEKILYKDLLFIHGRNAVVTLKIEGDTTEQRHVLIREIQKDPVQEKVLHVDFQEMFSTIQQIQKNSEIESTFRLFWLPCLPA